MAKLLNACLFALLFGFALGDDQDIADGQQCNAESGTCAPHYLMQLGAEAKYLSKTQAICETKPGSPNGDSHPKGCAGAVWSNGDPAKKYCTGDPHFDNSWWKTCCSWDDANGCVSNEEVDYVFVHGGHCNGGWISGSNTDQDALDACAAQCRSNAACGYFAYNSITEGCALYTAAAGCPDDDLHPDYNSYMMAMDLSGTWSPSGNTNQVAIVRNADENGYTGTSVSWGTESITLDGTTVSFQHYTGTLSSDGNRITWDNGGVWTRIEAMQINLFAAGKWCPHNIPLSHKRGVSKFACYEMASANSGCYNGGRIIFQKLVGTVFENCYCSTDSCTIQGSNAAYEIYTVTGVVS